MIMDYKITKNEITWLASLIVIITGYSIINTKLVPYLLELFPWDGVILGIILMVGGLWLLRIK